MRSVVLAMLLAAVCMASPAHAWTEAHPSGLVTEVLVDRDGGATVTLRVRWRVRAGRFRTFEVNELPTDFGLLEATATDASGVAAPVATRVVAPGRLEVTVGEDGGGLRRGAHDVVVRYTTSLRAQGLIRRSGNDAVIEFESVPWERGLEATEIRFAVPSSVRRAQWISDDTPGVDTNHNSETGRDVVHAIRRHLPPNTRWTARVACDPSLFGWLDGPRAQRRVQYRVAYKSYTPFAIAAAGLALGFLIAVLIFARTTRGPRLGGASPVLPYAAGGVAALGGVLQAASLLEVSGAVTAGLLVAAIALLALVPKPRDLAHVEPPHAARLVARGKLEIPPPITPPRFARLAKTLLFASALTCGVWAFRRNSPPLGVVTIDLALAWISALVFWRRRDALDAREPLAPYETVSHAALAALPGTRVCWKVRGDVEAPASASLRIVPRSGFRFVRGVRAIEVVCDWQRRVLRAQPVPTFVVRTELGSPLERHVRALVARCGEIEINAESNLVIYRVPLVGPDRDALAKLLRAVVPNAVARAQGASITRPANVTEASVSPS